MPLANLLVVAALEELADRLEIEDANPFRVRAYRNAARTIGDLERDVKAMIEGGESVTGLAAAQALGFEYLAITEHSRRQAMSHGLDPARLRQRCAAIGKLNARLAGLRVPTGIEDGTLDLPDDALKPLDIVVAAIHGQFNLSRAHQTERILRALECPHVRLLAHPTGRLIGEREPYDVDMLQIVRKAKARRAWLEPGDVLNTRSLAQLRSLLHPPAGANASRSANSRSLVHA